MEPFQSQCRHKTAWNRIAVVPGRSWPTDRMIEANEGPKRINKARTTSEKSDADVATMMIDVKCDAESVHRMTDDRPGVAKGTTMVDARRNAASEYRKKSGRSDVETVEIGTEERCDVVRRPEEVRCR